MAGKRLSMPGFFEVSAVCTHPEARGQGFARVLMSRVMEEFLAAGRTPFLHRLAENVTAIRVHADLGIVNVVATTDGIDYRQLEPALNRCQQIVESFPKQIVADGDYANHASVQIAEFPHAWIKERCGLRQFRCRGQEKTSMEATWACLSYNIIRWFSIRRKFNAAAAAAA
jgi:hypothetical protein